jgi:homospermidine synthase
MLITNISSLISLEDFTSILNCNVRKKEQTFNEKKQASIVINEKSIKKNKKHNNANLKLVDQLISKKEIENIAN